MRLHARVGPHAAALNALVQLGLACADVALKDSIEVDVLGAVDDHTVAHFVVPACGGKRTICLIT